MKVAPDLDPRPALRAWGLTPAGVEYLPVGFGDHHWRVTDETGRRWFATVADLAAKPHNGIGVAAARDGLRRAMDTAAALAHLDFVLAPAGDPLVPLGDRHALSVFPYVDGVSGDFGDPPGDVGDLLATLHRQPPPPSTPLAGPELPGRATLDRALAETDRPWTGGPFAEPARDLLARHRPGLRRRLDEFDRLLAALPADLVVTHGEPHPGNVLRTGHGRLLVDWDTVGLAVPERDLWWLGEGRPPAVEFYRLRWDLDDLSVFVEQFRAPHTRTADTEQAWDGYADLVAR